jgi:hypothetical protein
MHLDDAAAGAVGHRVEVAADPDTMPSRVTRRSSVRTRLKGMAGSALRYGFPSAKCSIECSNRLGCGRLEGSAKEEVFPHVAERALHHAPGLCPVGSAGFRPFLGPDSSCTWKSFRGHVTAHRLDHFPLPRHHRERLGDVSMPR